MVTGCEEIPESVGAFPRAQAETRYDSDKGIVPTDQCARGARTETHRDHADVVRIAVGGASGIIGRASRSGRGSRGAVTSLRDSRIAVA